MDSRSHYLEYKRTLPGTEKIKIPKRPIILSAQLLPTNTTTTAVSDHKKEKIPRRGKVGIPFKMRQQVVSSSSVTYTRGQGKATLYAPLGLTMLPIIEDTCCEALQWEPLALPPSSEAAFSGCRVRVRLP